MKFNVGDKVRFLNESGGGVITRIINANLVSVAIEDGFDIPTMASNLIMLDPPEKTLAQSRRDARVEIPVADPKMSSYGETQQSKLRLGYRASTHGAGLYLAFMPQDQQWLITGLIDIFLINYTDFSVLFSFNLHGSSGNFTGVDFASIDPMSKTLIETINREDLETWSEGVVQALFHKDESEKMLKPVNEPFKIKPVRFYKEESYIDSTLIDGKALMVVLCDLGLHSAVQPDNEFDKIDIPKASKSYAKPLRSDILIDKHRVTDHEAEVDLHISALRDNYDGLSNHEILHLQTSYFDQSLESAMLNNYTKVIYIHGIGNGVLKAALINKLKEYNDIEFRNAPFTNYGNGAIEIVIHQNR